VADLEEQLHVLATQRDAAILELSSAREEAEGSATALSNLQSVLEQFQRDKSSELNEALKRSQLELANTLSELNTLRTTYNTVQGQLNEARATEGLLYQQLKEREKRTEDLQQEGQ
jgi:septal ring factor EnvC (AmiA/AmiB activator)